MYIRNSNNNYNFKALNNIQKPLGQFYNANATLPTLIIESGVTLGRAYEANKRGGIPEATDRLIEQGISAIVWIYGVNLLKKFGDKLGKKFLKLDNLNFDIGFDELRNPIKNNNLSKKAIGFKASNILASTAIATIFIGAVLPKINNLILKKTLAKQENKQTKNKNTIKNIPDFKEFQEKTKKNINFTSLYDKTVSLAHNLENNSAARLFITDSGVIAGRFHNANNKYRKIEGLFRDIASIYFYLLCTPHIVKGLNYLTSNKNINPKALDKLVEHIGHSIQDKELTPKEFRETLFKPIDKEKLNQVDEMFKNNKTIDVEEFIKKFPKHKEKALEMTKLQPIFNQQGILSKLQAQDVLKENITSEPKFLKSMFNYVTEGKSDDKFKYVSRKKLETIRNSIDDFMEQIISSAEKSNSIIDINYIKKLAKNNMRKNLLFNIIGTITSIFALGIMIPKIQYKITNKLTHDNKFHAENEK